VTSLTNRRIAAGLSGLVATVFAAVWTFVAERQIHVYAAIHLAQNIPLSQSKGPRPDAYDDRAKLAYIILIAAMILAAGTSISLRVLTPRAGWSTRAAGYFIILLVLLPLTLYNYTQDDLVLSKGVQAALNLVLIFLAVAMAWWLAKFEVSALDGRVLKIMSLTLIVGSGVLVPVFFTSLWALNQAGILSLEQTKHVEFGQIAGLSGLGSLVISWLNYRRERRKEKQSAEAAASRIVLK
jgi:hypothetical protein